MLQEVPGCVCFIVHGMTTTPKALCNAAPARAQPDILTRGKPAKISLTRSIVLGAARTALIIMQLKPPTR